MILNAKIDDADLFVEDHGLMTFGVWITTSAGWSTCVGMFDLKGCDDASTLIRDILKIAGVTRWSELKGKYIRIDDNNKWNSTITKIGNIMEENWIDLRSYFL